MTTMMRMWEWKEMMKKKLIFTPQKFGFPAHPTKRAYEARCETRLRNARRGTPLQRSQRVSETGSHTPRSTGMKRGYATRYETRV